MLYYEIFIFNTMPIRALFNCINLPHSSCDYLVRLMHSTAYLQFQIFRIQIYILRRDEHSSLGLYPLLVGVGRQ